MVESHSWVLGLFQFCHYYRYVPAILRLPTGIHPQPIDSGFETSLYGRFGAGIYHYARWTVADRWGGFLLPPHTVGVRWTHSTPFDLRRVC